jgi:hypothetical protein
MAKKTAEVPPAAPDAPATETQNTVAATPTSVPTSSGGKIVAFVAGGVVAAALLFGGGVATGIALPIGDGGRPGIGQFPGGQQPQGGPKFGGQGRDGQPGGGQHDRDGDSDSHNGGPAVPPAPNQDDSTNN